MDLKKDLDGIVLIKIFKCINLGKGCPITIQVQANKQKEEVKTKDPETDRPAGSAQGSVR